MTIDPFGFHTRAERREIAKGVAEGLGFKWIDSEYWRCGECFAMVALWDCREHFKWHLDQDAS